ncbi:MAG: PAS/PAC sensor hybrid histidine kinase [Halanaerobium sp.]|nr:MAG: PAS/PAC sensor hybrid histidine kinase [Halanaerobium sp.]
MEVLRMFFLGAALLVLLIIFVIHLCRNSKRNMQMNNLKLKDYEAILNNTHDAIFLVEVIYDQEVIFKLKRLNTTYERLTGFREEDLIGKSPEEILIEEESEIVKSRYVKCMQKGETISYEETLELPRGKKTWHTKLTPVFDGNNRVIQLIGSSRDITKMKKVEKNIKVSENKFKQIYEDNPVGLIKSDPEGNILDLNKKMLQIINAPGKDHNN